jgi:hypothetical protein
MSAMPDYPLKITFREMLASGVRDVLIYCRDHKCSRSTIRVCLPAWRERAIFWPRIARLVVAHWANAFGPRA